MEGVARAVDQPGFLIEAVVRDEDGRGHATQGLLARDHGHVGQGALVDGEVATHGATVVRHSGGAMALEVGQLHVGKHQVPVVGQRPEHR